MNYPPAKGRFSRHIGWFFVLIGALFYCYEYLLRISPSVMLADLMRSFQITAAGLGNFSVFYYYAYIPMQLPVGFLMDRFGPRVLLTLASLSCALGAFLFGGTPYFWVATIGRFLIGLGSSFAFVGVLKIASVWLPPQRFALVSGLTTMLGMIGAMVGDISLTLLVQERGWRYTIFILAWVGLALALLIYVFIRNAKKDAEGAATLVEDPTFSVLLMWQEFLTIIKTAQVWLVGSVGCLLYFSLVVFADMWGIPYLETVHRLSITQASAANSMIYLGWAIGAPLMGFLSDYFRRRVLLLRIAGLLSGIIISLILFWPTHNYFLLSGLLFSFGLTSAAQVLVFALAKENSSLSFSGTAIAVTNMIVMFGGIVQLLVAKALDFYWSGNVVNGVRVYSPYVYQMALLLLPVAMFAAFTLTFWLHETRGQQADH